MAEEYVKGRLPQEENPTPGRYPGFVASHDVSKDGSQDMRITGKKNPLPSMLYGIDSEGNPKPVNVDENGNVLTQLTGSNVEDGLPVKQVSSGVDYEQKVNEVILAGAEKIVFSEQNLKIDEVFFLVEGVNPHDFSIRVVTKAYSFDGRYHQTLNENSEGKYSAAIERFKNNLHNISFRVKNNSDESQEYRAFIKQMWLV